MTKETKNRQIVEDELINSSKEEIADEWTGPLWCAYIVCDIAEVAILEVCLRVI